MSRNLCKTTCDQCCGRDVRKVEPNRLATERDVGRYSEYIGMVVANAECFECGAKYLAWVDIGDCEHAKKYRVHYMHERPDHAAFSDLSYRSTFNDEPGAADLPTRPVLRLVMTDLALALFHVCKAMSMPPDWWDWYESASRFARGDGWS